jgi:hypothetical protein
MAGRKAESRSRKLADLVARASRQPGVKELMELYRDWSVLEERVRPYRQAMAVRRIVSVSDTSGALRSVSR